MKKAILIVLFSILFIPQIAFAKDLSLLKVSFSDNINASCGISAGFNPIKACYLAGDDHIVIRSYIPFSYFPPSLF